MVRYKIAAFDPHCHEAWVWWDASRRGFRGEIHCKGTDADPQDSYVLHVGADASIATVQALVEAIGSYASLDIEQKVRLLQDKAATPCPCRSVSMPGCGGSRAWCEFCGECGRDRFSRRSLATKVDIELERL